MPAFFVAGSCAAGRAVPECRPAACSQGRTYRYFNGKVQYPFGYGLSYTSFGYAWTKQPATVKSLKDTLSFTITIKNTGPYDGDETAQVYIQYPPQERMPLKELKAFKRITLAKGTEKQVRFSIPLQELQKWDLKEKKWKLVAGTYSLLVGSHSQDVKLSASLRIPEGIR